MQQFNIDISQPRGPLVIYASQGDSMSRFFEVTMTDNGAAYEPPAGAVYTVRFGAPGKPAGWYDTITEQGGGTHPAVVVDGNTYTVEIAEQALGTPGKNALVLIVSDATGYTLATCAFELQVTAVPGYDAPEATVYYNALTEQVAQTLANVQAAAASASAAAASAAQAAESAASIDPTTLVKEVNGETPVDGAVYVTTRNLAYQVGDTITTTDAGFDPNTAIGGTWMKKTSTRFDETLGPVNFINGYSAEFAGACIFTVSSNGICTVNLSGLNKVNPGQLLADNLPLAAVETFVSVGTNGGRLQTQYAGGLLYVGPQLEKNEFISIVYQIQYESGKKYYTWTKTA